MSVPGDEQSKAFIAILNLLLVPYHDESSPSCFHAFMAPSHPSRAGTPSPGVPRRPGEGDPALLPPAGTQCLATWNPDHNPAFSCPARSEPPRGPVVCASGKSHHSTSHCSTSFPATVPHHGPGRDSPPTASPQGSPGPAARSPSHPVSPAASRRDGHGQASILLPSMSPSALSPGMPCPQPPPGEPSAASATHSNSPVPTTLLQRDLLNATHLQQPLPELVSPPFPLTIIFDSSFHALPASRWQREKP